MFSFVGPLHELLLNTLVMKSPLDVPADLLELDNKDSEYDVLADRHHAGLQLAECHHAGHQVTEPPSHRTPSLSTLRTMSQDAISLDATFLPDTMSQHAMAQDDRSQKAILQDTLSQSA